MGTKENMELDHSNCCLKVCCVLVLYDTWGLWIYIFLLLWYLLFLKKGSEDECVTQLFS